MKKILKTLFISSFLFIYLQATTFQIKSDFPKENQWVKELLQLSLNRLNKMFLNSYTHLPNKIVVNINKKDSLKGISANANNKNNSLNFTSNLWQKDKYRIWIMIHELTNLLSSYYGSNAYPSDWWANGRSPFPEYISVLIMQKLGYKKEALWRKKVHIDKSDHKFYWNLHRRFGTKLFKDFFYLLKKHNIDLRKIGKKWPSPDKQRSLMTLSLLSLAANKNLANLASFYKIGKKPRDWEKRHPEIKFQTYSISNNDINNYIKNYLLSSK